MSEASSIDRKVGRPVPMRSDWSIPTTYLRRFSDAVALLCGGRTPAESMVTDWLSGADDALQDFAAEHGPAWAQGIVLLDAAAVLADTPTEGVEHESRPKTPNAEIVRLDAAGGQSERMES